MQQDDDNELIPTRTTLLARLKDWQDDSSWQDFFNTYWKLIHRVAVKSGLNDAEAQDVVQETMIAVSKKMPGFTYDRTLGSFKSWLFNLTRWRVSDQFRRRTSSKAPDALHDTDAQNVLDPASEALNRLWDTEWENHLLESATIRLKRRLEPAKYQVYDFYVNKEWAAEKVAELFAIPVEQVYQVKYRATELIKEEVERLKKDTA